MSAQLVSIVSKIQPYSDQLTSQLSALSSQPGQYANFSLLFDADQVSAPANKFYH